MSVSDSPICPALVKMGYCNEHEGTVYASAKQRRRVRRRYASANVFLALAVLSCSVDTSCANAAQHEHKHEGPILTRSEPEIDLRPGRALIEDDTDTEPIPSQYIVGGSRSQPTRYPYLASLGLSKTDHACAATLIAPDLLLSAAHCHGSFRWAVFGLYNRKDHGEHHHGNQGRQYIRIQETYMHPAYRWSEKNPDVEFDFLVIKLSEPADTTRFPTIQLNRNPKVPRYNNQRLTIAGWGATDSDGDNLSNTLRHAHLGYVDPDICDESDGYIKGHYYSYRGFLTSSMMCAWSETVDACLGDSGGPLLITSSDGDARKDMQVGIVSFGVGCNSPDFPGLYSRISDQIGWIDEMVCTHSEDPPADFECGRDAVPIDADREPIIPTRRPTEVITRRPTFRPTARATPRPTVRPTKFNIGESYQLDDLLSNSIDWNQNKDEDEEERYGGAVSRPTAMPTRRMWGDVLTLQEDNIAVVFPSMEEDEVATTASSSSVRSNCLGIFASALITTAFALVIA